MKIVLTKLNFADGAIVSTKGERSIHVEYACHVPCAFVIVTRQITNVLDLAVRISQLVVFDIGKEFFAAILPCNLLRLTLVPYDFLS